MRRAPQEDLECVSTVLSDNGWTRPEVAYDSGEQSGCSCGEGICLSGLHVGCSDCVARRRWSAGIEFTILKPHISNNVAFTTIESDGATFETRRETWFNYGSKLAPRVWIEMSRGSKLGLRFHYWQFNFGSDSVVGSPDASGLERVFHPVFADIDLAATVPDSEYRADSTLNAYVFDLEATRSVGCGNWIIVGSSGLRIADIEQTYTSQLINESGQQQGAIDFQHSTQGVGPTVSLRAQRPFLRRFSLFGLARGSLIFGEGVSQLTGVEDEGLDTEFTTRQRTERDDVLPIGELQVGLQWMPRNFGVWHPYVHLAMEGQVWQDVGNAANEVGDLGLFGANIALGFNW